MADIDLTTTATIPSASQSITVTVNEDTNGDGTADNTASQSIDNGTNTYTLAGFDRGTGDDYWLDIEPDTSDDEVTASLDSATIDAGPKKISAPVTAADSVTPNPGVSPGPVTVAAPTSTVASATPLPEFARTIGAPVTTVAASTPPPEFSRTIGAPATTVSADTPAPQVGFFHWQLDGTLIPTAIGETAAYDTVAVTFRAETQKLLNAIRAAKSDEGKVDILTTDDGGFRSVDRSNDNNTFTLTPPATRRPLRQSGDYHVTRYEEDLVSQSVDEWDVEIEFAPDANRTDSPPISETADANEWGLTTRHGTIATGRVDAEFLGTGADGVERFELVARLTFQQARVLEAALARLGGVRVRKVVDESNQAVDETAGGANTITIDSPTPTVVSDGDYVAMDFESTRLNDAFQEVALEVAKK